MTRRQAVRKTVRRSHIRIVDRLLNSKLLHYLRFALERTILLSAVITTTLLALCASQSFAIDTVQVQMIGGTIHNGTLAGIDEQNIRLESSSGAKQLPIADINLLTFTASRLIDAVPPLELTLLDGSRLRGNSFRGKGNEWQLESRSYQTSSIPPKNIRSLTFKPLAEKQLAGWNDAVSDPSQNDGLVVTRPNGEITRVGGTILEIKNGQVSFEFDDQKLEMSSEKLLGLLWFQPNADRKIPAIEVRTIDQSFFQAVSIKVNSGQLECMSAAGLVATVPLQGVMDIRFSASNLRWLAETEKIESFEEKPTNWKFSVDIAKQAFAPRFISESPSARDPSPSDQDLLFSSPGTYSFRMPEGFRRLESRVQRSENGTVQSKLTIQVWQDSEKVTETALEVNQDYVDIKAILKPEKKIRLVVTSSDPMNLGTEIQWKQPRLLR
jgi:hypothetical protein